MTGVAFFLVLAFAIGCTIVTVGNARGWSAGRQTVLSILAGLLLAAVLL